MRFFRNHLVFSILFFSLFFIAETALHSFATELNLVPYPKKIELNPTEGGFSLENSGWVVRVCGSEKDVLAAGLLEELARSGFPNVEIHEESDFANRLVISRVDAKFKAPPLPCQVGDGGSDPGEGYAISISPESVVCLGKDRIGLYYSVQTLRQLIRANLNDKKELPALEIQDWPSMQYRCFQDDLSRGPSPHLETLYYEFDLGSQFKHNMFTYYMEDQFEFKKHPKINPKNGTLSQEEFKKSVDFAADRHLIILGCQQSFAHHEKVLAIPEYAHLGEAGYILSPAVEEVYTYLDDLYSEVTPLLPFDMFAVCCDETWDLAKSGPSKELADKIGVGSVYVGHILRVRELMKKYNKRILLSGDIIVGHPDKLPQLPKDVIMMCWDYNAREDFDPLIKPFSESGFEFFVCPSQANWSVMLPLFQTSCINIRNFVRDGLKNGAIGMINTGWEDDGESIHGYNWHGIAWGAECSWNASKTELTDFNRRLGPVLFGSQGEDFGRAIELLTELQVSPELGSSRNSRFWERDFIPLLPLERVEKNANAILESVRPAIELLEKTKKEAVVNAHLLDSFLVGARRIELIATRMLDGVDVSKRYATASILDLSQSDRKEKAIDELKQIETLIEKNRKLHREVEKEFVRIWNSESKPYALDRVTEKYDALDQWFVNLLNQVRDVKKRVQQGTLDQTLPDIGLETAALLRKTKPARVESNPLSPERPWVIQDAVFRLGVVVEAGNADRSFLPVELDLTLSENCREKPVRAFLLQGNGKTEEILSQRNGSATESQHRIALLIPELKKNKTAEIHIYFGGEQGSEHLSDLSVMEISDQVQVAENSLIKAQLGSEGGHVFHWHVKKAENHDMTDPGENFTHGFSDHGYVERTIPYQLRCLNHGPVLVRFGCFAEGELAKTLTFYANSPIMEVNLTNSTPYYWDFDDPANFTTEGRTLGTILFSNGTTVPVAPKGSTAGIQIREKNVFWGIKYNVTGLALGLCTPEEPSYFVVGPGGAMGGVGIESGASRSHFITFAGTLDGDDPEVIMNQIQETFNMKNQPKVILHARETP